MKTKPTRFTCDWLPNTHIEFTPKGVKLIVTLNIEKRMRHFLSPNNVFKGDKHYVYSICALLQNPCEKTLLDTYNTIMQGMMIRLRDAKIAVLENEKKDISERKIFY
jgi:hypothetical protein